MQNHVKSQTQLPTAKGDIFNVLVLFDSPTPKHIKLKTLAGIHKYLAL